MAQSGNHDEGDGPGEASTSPGARSVDPMIGRLVNANFRVLKLIGMGAMGHVYQAEQMSLGKMVAIKILRNELMSDEKLIKRFELEAKNASSLNHPNSIQIIDFGRDRDMLFIAMELLRGVDLGQLIQREGALPYARVARIVDQVLAALDEAHAQGIIHRDLKPGNIMLVSRRGDVDFVKVCDFGIAKCQTSREGIGLTMKGLVCGTPEYMSPEQARGEEVDGRSDLYALGVILYQLVTGELPFTASSPVGILSKHLAEPPQPPSLRRPGLGLPPAFEGAILRALAKNPADRPQTADEMRRELHLALGEGVLTPVQAMHSMGSGSSGSVPVQTWSTQPRTAGGQSISSKLPAVAVGTPTAMELPRRRRTPLVTLGVALVVAVVGISWFMAQQQGLGRLDPAPPRPAPAPPPATATAELAPPLPAAAAPSPPEPALAPAPAPAPERASAPPAGPVATTPVAARTASKVRDARKNRRLAVAGAPAPAAGAPDSAAPAALPSSSAPAEPAPAAVAAVAPAPSPATPSAGGSGDVMRDAERLLGQGEVASACKKGEELRRNDAKPTLYKFLGKCYMRAGQPERAKENYRKYLELVPEAADAAFIRSIVR
jgi:serine/threonine protein kinase